MSSRREERKKMVPQIRDVTVITCDECGVEAELADPEFGIMGLKDWGFVKTSSNSRDLCPVCLAKVEAVLG